jgi:hypothetical protein
MIPHHDQPQRRRRAGRRRPGPFQSLREWWSDQDRQRHIRQMEADDHRLALGELFVIDALARQLEEIPNLPEVLR